MRTPMENAALEAAGRGVARSALAGSLLWVGALKFAEYEAENIRPMVSTSPLFSWIGGQGRGAAGAAMLTAAESLRAARAA